MVEKDKEPKEKDPAALIYIANYLAEVAEMDADERGWYTMLILHQYDKTTLPTDVEKLGVLAGVKFSEYSRWKAVWENKLSKLFKRVDIPNGNQMVERLVNQTANKIICKRVEFTEKREKSGLIAAIVKKAINDKRFKSEPGRKWLIDYLSGLEQTQLRSLSSTNVNHLVNHLVNLYINRDIVIDKDKDNDIKVDAKNNLIVLQTKFMNDFSLHEKVAKDCEFTPAQLKHAVDKFWFVKSFEEDLLNKPYGDLQQHFVNWCRLKKETVKSQRPDGGISGDEDYTGTNAAL